MTQPLIQKALNSENFNGNSSSGGVVRGEAEASPDLEAGGKGFARPLLNR
jgi:hypothetical protein